MPENYVLSFERVVDVAPEKLYAGWTEPNLILKWFTPEPWRTIRAEIELRPGGAYESLMQSPEGHQVANKGCVLDFVPARHFAFTNMMTKGFKPKAMAEGEFAFVGKLDFEPAKVGTVYRAKVYHQDQKGMELHAQMGFDGGWNKALDQLVDLIKREYA